MNRLTLHRLASALLCLTRALSLTACGGKKKPAPAAGNGGEKETISDSRTDQTGQTDQVKPSEQEAEMKQALDLFNSYARGGIEILYEAFTSDAIINQDDAVDYAYKMIYDQQAHADVQSSDLDQLLKPEY